MSVKPGTKLPAYGLRCTDGGTANIGEIKGKLILFVVPGPSLPGWTPPEGWMDGWMAIPGAAGCTKECQLVNDNGGTFEAGGAKAFVVSRQPANTQRAIVQGKQWGIQMLSDERGALGHEIGLDTFKYEGGVYYKRTTLVIVDGVVTRVIGDDVTPEQHVAAALE